MALGKGNLKVNNQYLLSNDTKRVYGGVETNASKRIVDSTRQLQQRNLGIDEIMGDGLDNNQFFEKFLSDLSDIETINSRVERDV